MAVKVCFVASSGGHTEEISRLKRIEKMYDCSFITEKSDFKQPEFCEKNKYFVPQINRKELFFIPKFIWLHLLALRYILRLKPDVVITTGALVAYPFCMVAKHFHKKVIYIESFARVEDTSLTGSLLYKHVDLFVVQWEDMLKKYPKAVLGGGIF